MLLLQSSLATSTAINLGCNPAAGDIHAALGTATATDACGAVTDHFILMVLFQVNGCNSHETRTFTATRCLW